MAVIEQHVCDNCGKKITDEIATTNDTIITINSRNYFTGELCNACLSQVKEAIKTNSRDIIKS